MSLTYGFFFGGGGGEGGGLKILKIKKKYSGTENLEKKSSAQA